MAATATAQTYGACEPARNTFYSALPDKLVTPAYYFPSLKATGERPAMPVAMTVWREPCAIDGSAVLWMRLTADFNVGGSVPIPKVTVIQDGIEKGWFGGVNGGYGSVGFRWHESFSNPGGLGSLTASLYTTVPFHPDRAFTLKMRISNLRQPFGWNDGTPDVVYEIPARGTPGNVADIPDDMAGLWWNPAEPGTALILDRNQRGATYAAWATYDDNGDSTWFVMTNSRPSADGGVEGAAYTLRGQPFTQPQLDTAFGAEVVGRFHLKFTNASNGEFNYQVNGRSGRMPIQRFEVRKPNGTVCRQIRNIQQIDGLIGWGINLEGDSFQTGCAVHATLLTYDNEGKPMMVFGGLGLDDSGSKLSGTVYRPRGTPYGLPHDPSRFVLGLPVGSWEHGRNAYPQTMRIAVEINGVSRTLDLSRFYFEY